MVELDGIQYEVNTPTENAEAAIRWVNQYCIDNQVKNSKGEIVNLEIAPGSPLYLILLGFAYLATMLQNVLFNLGKMLNIGSCSDRQIISLGEIVRMRPKPESYTTIKALVYATSEGDCNITTLLTASIQVGNTLVTFMPLFDVTVPASSAAVILLQATSLGSFFIEAEAITSFDENPANLYQLVTQSSLPGREAESITSFRQRVQLRSTASSAIENCVRALRDLPGIQAANIFFNISNEVRIINNYQVDPRKAIAFIQGYNPNIAFTIYSYLLCDMMPLSLSQNYTLNNGQVVTAYWDTPLFVPIHVQVFIENELSVAMNASVVTAVQALALSVDIAGALSTADIIAAVNAGEPGAIVTGAQIRLLDSSSFYQRLVAGPNELFEFIRSNIEVINVK